MENTTYILNPDYIVRNDKKRILLFTKNNPSKYSSQSWYSIIHPVQAMILSFFSKKRLLDEAIHLVSSFLEIDYEVTKTKLMPFIENPEPFFNAFNGLEFSFPKMLIIKADSKYRDEFTPEDMICKTIDFETKRLYSGPLHISLMLTNRCVTNCCYCYANTSKQIENPLSTNKILNLITEAKELKLQNFNILGGEIFLHDDWHIILKELVKHEFFPVITSTKVPLTKKILSKLEETNYTKNIQISLDSVSSDKLQHSLCVDKEYLNKVKNGIDLMENRNFSYQIASVLTKYNNNVEDILEMFNFLSSLKKITSWHISPAIVPLYKNTQDFSTIKPDKKSILEIYSFIEKEIKPRAHFYVELGYNYLNREYYSTDKGSAFFPGKSCSALNNHFFILPDGKVTICEQLYWNPNFIIGDVNINTLAQIWNSTQSLRLVYIKKKDIDTKSRCKSCHFFNNCFQSRNRCWADIIKAYGEEHWDYPDPRCKWAPKMTNSMEY